MTILLITNLNCSSGLAAGRWILTREFVDDSCDQQSWVDPLNYVHDQVRVLECWKYRGIL